MPHDEERGRQTLQLKLPPADTTATVTIRRLHADIYPSDDEDSVATKDDIITTDLPLEIEIKCNAFAFLHVSGLKCL